MSSDVLAVLALAAVVFRVPAIGARLRGKLGDIPAVVRALARWLR
jgi:hypothetical protein